MDNQPDNAVQVPSKTSCEPAKSVGRDCVAWTILALVLGIHAVQTYRLFPSWAAFLDDRPVLSVDHAIHIYHGYLGARFLKEHFTSWGYDPFFMAGYPKTPVYDSSSGPAELAQLLAGAVYSPRAYKIGVAVMVLLSPILVVAASWAYGAKAPSVTATAVWTVWYWWSGFPDPLVRTGLVAFVWSAAVSAVVPPLLSRWGTAPSWRRWLALTLTAAVGLQAHSLFSIMTVAGLGVGYVWLSLETVDYSGARKRARSWRWHVATWGALTAALAATSFWCWPLLRFFTMKTSSGIFLVHHGRVIALVRQYYLLEDGRIPLLSVMFGLMGLVRWWRDGRTRGLAMVVAQLVALSSLTFLGSAWSVTKNLEPLRFQVPLALVWCVAAGDGLLSVLEALDPRALFRSSWAWIRWTAAVCFVALVVVLTFPSACVWIREFRLRPHWPSTWKNTVVRITHTGPLGVGLRPEMLELVEWVREHTDSSARILLEDQLRLLENLDPEAPESLHWTPLLPVLTDREYIGGLYEAAFIPHNYASFGDWHLAGRHIRDWTPEELRRFCDQYNIGWVVTWSRASPLKQGPERSMPLSTEVFASMPFCEPIATIPRHTTRLDENEYAIFRVAREPSYFAKGRGRLIAVDFNRIELTDLEPEAGELVLRYHWQENLRSDPPLSLERADVSGDPVGFIRIKTAEPLSRLVIVNGY